MTEPFPAIFISHGSPLMALQGGTARDFLQGLGKSLGDPRAVVMVSAHWETDGVAVSTAGKQSTIHDFGGFPQALYDMHYPAPGAPELAADVARRLLDAGFCVTEDPERGLDHGAWIPMMLMYPEADIPVFQVSIDPEAGPDHHLKLGQILRGLRAEGVLIVASGSMGHNLGEVRRDSPDMPAYPWVAAFADWVHDRTLAHDIEALLNYRSLAPHAVRNHPRDEHFLPLFAAIGAGNGTAGRRLHQSTMYGALAMDAYAFD